MKRMFTQLSAAALIAFSASAVQAQLVPLVKQPHVANPQRVLFVGNSLLYYSGGLQTHTHRIAAAATPPIDVRAGYQTINITGASLEEFPIEYLVKPGNLRNKQAYQLVVLSPSSRDAMSAEGRATYRQKVIEFDNAIKPYGGRVALILNQGQVPPGEYANTDMDQRLEEMTISVGNEIGALVIPLGTAFREAYRQRPGIKLQVYDGYHASVAGQYLAAAVVFNSLYGRTTQGNPYDYFGALDKDTKEFVQRVADETVGNFYARK